MKNLEELFHYILNSQMAGKAIPTTQNLLEHGPDRIMQM